MAALWHWLAPIQTSWMISRTPQRRLRATKRYGSTTVASGQSRAIAGAASPISQNIEIREVRQCQQIGSQPSERPVNRHTGFRTCPRIRRLSVARRRANLSLASESIISHPPFFSFALPACPLRLPESGEVRWLVAVAPLRFDRRDRYSLAFDTGPATGPASEDSLTHSLSTTHTDSPTPVQRSAAQFSWTKAFALPPNPPPPLHSTACLPSSHRNFAFAHAYNHNPRLLVVVFALSPQSSPNRPPIVPINPDPRPGPCPRFHLRKSSSLRRARQKATRELPQTIGGPYTSPPPPPTRLNFLPSFFHHRRTTPRPIRLLSHPPLPLDSLSCDPPSPCHPRPLEAERNRLQSSPTPSTALSEAAATHRGLFYAAAV
ncbi:hypothetical protein V8E51_003253 [Hyaloscypha variabilis]